MMKITLQSIKHCLRMKLFLADVNHRRCSLLRAGILGAGLACIAYCLTSIFGLCNDILQSSITILTLGLPTFYVLWKFRTYDVQRQIDKVQKQIAKTEEGTNNSTFFECARMLAEGEPIPENVKDYNLIKHKSLPTKTALEQLAYLKMKTDFDENRIDALTRGLNLIKKNFNSARFNGLDLSEAELNEADLSRADLTFANLTFANLTRADLTFANLTRANLTGATLPNATLNEADLTGAELTGAELTGAELTGAELTGADLTIANLTRANLTGATLPNATLNEADLTGAELNEAKLNGADLTEAKLNKAILIDAELIGAKLVGAKLNEADLTGAKLNGAELDGAELTGAELTGADLNDANLTGAIYDDKTKFNFTILDSKETLDKAGMIYRPDEQA